MAVFEKFKINGRGVLWSQKFGGDAVQSQDGGICRQRAIMFTVIIGKKGKRRVGTVSSLVQWQKVQ